MLPNDAFYQSQLKAKFHLYVLGKLRHNDKMSQKSKSENTHTHKHKNSISVYKTFNKYFSLTLKLVVELRFFISGGTLHRGEAFTVNAE